MGRWLLVEPGDGCLELEVPQQADLEPLDKESVVRVDGTRQPLCHQRPGRAPRQYTILPSAQHTEYEQVDAAFSRHLSPAAGSVTCALLDIGTAWNWELWNTLPGGTRASF